MTKKIAGNGPIMTLVVTDRERAIAKEVKKDFKEIMKKLVAAIKTITTLQISLAEAHPTKEDLKTKHKGQLLRYRRKIQNAFNDFLSSVKLSLEKLSEISDPDMIRLREILIAEIGELSAGVETILDLLKEVDKEGFSKTLDRVSAQLLKRQKSINDVIDSQLFGHIDHDILGKMKISELTFRIKRRARILRKLVREG